MGVCGEAAAAKGEVVRLLGEGGEIGNRERYWYYGFGLDGALANDVLVRRSGHLDPRVKESFGRINPGLLGKREIGEGFILAHRQGGGVWLALGYLGFDGRLVIGSCALNGAIKGFDPPWNWLVLYKRDIEWLRGLRARDRKMRRAKELEFEELLRQAKEDRERNEALNRSMLAKKRAVLARGEWRKKVLANLQAVQATLKLDRILEPMLGVKFASRLSGLERRVAALEEESAKGKRELGLERIMDRQAQVEAKRE